MKVLIRKAQIICPSSPFHGQQKDIFIKDGVISAISGQINETADQVIEQNGLHASIGWMDSFAHFCDPGLEYRETLETGAAAAAAGGFTSVLVLPNTSPAIHAKTQVEYIVQQSKPLSVNIYPIGAVTKNTEGKELAEMYDMKQSGALAFGDGIHTIQNSGLLIKALLYIKSFQGIVIQVPDDNSIAPGGLMNEGIISTRLGLPGKPAIAEELIVARDIKLAQYTDSKLHFTGISSAKSLDFIREAKQNGIKISCAVTPYHLYFSDEELVSYDTNLKVNPPIKTNNDREALRLGLADGSIDCIASHHIPYNYDNKVCEFEYAKNGMIGLETLFGVLWSIMSSVWPVSTLVEKLSQSPREIFGLPMPQIKIGAAAELTLFNPDTEYIFEQSQLRSKSVNSAFIGKSLKGKVIGIVNKNQVILNK